MAWTATTKNQRPPQELQAGQMKRKPSLYSTEGIGMLSVAAFVEILNMVFALLDFLVIGLLLGFIVNALAALVIGGWLWIRAGKIPWKKGVLPFFFNSVPILKILPFWVLAVWTSLEK